MKKLTDRCCSQCIDSEFQRCPKVTECLSKRPLAECHEDDACVEKRNAIIRKIRYGNGILLKLTACSFTPQADVGKIIQTILMELRQRELDHVSLTMTGSLGWIAEAPFLSIASPDHATVVYARVTAEKIPRIIAEHIEHGLVVKEWVFGQMADDSRKLMDSVPVIQYLDFFRAQNLRVLQRCGLIDPENLDEFFLAEGFLAFSKALHRMTPDEVINLVGVASLRGRGGNGEQVSKKWMRLSQAGNDATSRDTPTKYLICNAHEGYAPSIKDRTLLESDPFAVIEGMLITAYAVQATEGLIYINSAYQLAIQRLQNALALAREHNYVGKEILGTSFSFDIEIRHAPADYLAGEATSIISFLEGDIGPRAVPPYPERKGLWGKPTLIHNVETLVNLPLLVQHDFSWFTSTGTTENPGTKCLTLSGAIQRPGLIEVPLGTTIREIIFDIGGGSPPDQPLKAVQLGGPLGGYLAPEQFETLCEHDALQALGLQMGTGTLEVLDQSVCVVARVRKQIEYTHQELCGQCTAGREGIYQIGSILQAICEGQEIVGCPKRIANVHQRLAELAGYTQQASLCAYCSSATLSVLTSLNAFRKEYEDHLQKRCKAGVCF